MRCGHRARRLTRRSGVIPSPSLPCSRKPRITAGGGYLPTPRLLRAQGTASCRAPTSSTAPFSRPPGGGPAARSNHHQTDRLESALGTRARRAGARPLPREPGRTSNRTNQAHSLARIGGLEGLAGRSMTGERLSLRLARLTEDLGLRHLKADRARTSPCLSRRWSATTEAAEERPVPPTLCWKRWGIARTRGRRPS